MHKFFPGFIFSLFFTLLFLFSFYGVTQARGIHKLPSSLSDEMLFITDTVAPGDTLPARPVTDLEEAIPDGRRELTRAPEEKDELPRSAIPWYTEQQLQNPFLSEPNYADTSLLGVHLYDYANVSGFFNATKGNSGHVYRSQVFQPEVIYGTTTGHKALYGGYLFSHDSLRFYRPKHVFTDLFFLMGDEREQIFYANHAQKLHETFHMGFQYRVINSPGAYSRLGARNTNLYFTADYLSEDKRYQALASIIYNRLRSQESGGLKNPAAFEEEAVRDSVFLYRAESAYRDFSVNIRHFYQTGFYTGGDTVSEGRFINLGRFNHDFTYSRKAFLFDETAPPASFYDFPVLDSLATRDSTTLHKIENLVSWSNFPLSSGRGTFPFNFRIFLKHSINTIEQPDELNYYTLDTLNNKIHHFEKYNYNEIVQGLELQSDQSRFLSFGAYANLTIGGYNDEDFHAGTYVNLGQENRKVHLEGRLRYSLMEAPYFYNNFSGNYARWENSFDKMQVSALQVSAHFPAITLEGNYYLLENMVYFNSDALPVQNTSGFGFFNLGARSDAQLGRFGFRNHIIFQQSTSSRFEDYPDLTSYHSLYYNFNLSGGALVNMLGFDFRYNTGYQALTWMPVTRGFYAQNDYTTRDNMQLDVFWSGKIKSARLFIKYQNLLGLVTEMKPRYHIPYYPIPESMFKFGVSWMFFN